MFLRLFIFKIIKCSLTYKEENFDNEIILQNEYIEEHKYFIKFKEILSDKCIKKLISDFYFTFLSELSENNFVKNHGKELNSIFITYHLPSIYICSFRHYSLHSNLKKLLNYELKNYFSLFCKKSLKTGDFHLNEKFIHLKKDAKFEN
ncbi:hypothetical protein EHP00_1278 [Ecytonucleospora hepatopenaei]|uniref:Uncharacterized protein n=1 Tax=Ecytonucleospora hepatopenaei TaxID=646526 RepID=A0A1W0E6D0_9MICR|nr:hypothetical protein EHP00_1278 [Ecytonucleospora hepatopenaei]